VEVKTMDLEKVNSLGYRTLFFGSFLLLAVAVLEFVLNWFGYTVLQAIGYTAGRLLQLAALLLTFVLALLLRQVRDELKKAKIH